MDHRQLTARAIAMIGDDATLIADSRAGMRVGNSIVGSLLSIETSSPRQYTEAAVAAAVAIIDAQRVVVGPTVPTDDSPRGRIRAWLADLIAIDPHDLHTRECDHIPKQYAHIWDNSVDGCGGEGYETLGACEGIEAQVRWTPEGYQPHGCYWWVRVWDGETDEVLLGTTNLDDLADRLASE